jgi:hypothetical protein
MSSVKELKEGVFDDDLKLILNSKKVFENLIWKI